MMELSSLELRSNLELEFWRMELDSMEPEVIGTEVLNDGTQFVGTQK